MGYPLQELAALVSRFDVLLAQVDADGLSSEMERNKIGRSRSAKNIQGDSSFRTGGQNGNLTQILRIGCKVRFPLLSIFRQDVPNVTRLAAFRMISEKVEAFLAEFACSSGYTLGIGMGCPLLASNNHAEVGKPPFDDFLQHIVKGCKRRFLFLFGQLRGKLDLPFVPHTADASC
jgi:hypothetical protein